MWCEHERRIDTFPHTFPHLVTFPHPTRISAAGVLRQMEGTALSVMVRGIVRYQRIRRSFLKGTHTVPRPAPKHHLLNPVKTIKNSTYFLKIQLRYKTKFCFLDSTKYQKSWRLHWSNRLDSSHTPLQVTRLSVQGLLWPRSIQTFLTPAVQVPLRRIRPLRAR